ncbi:DUF4340 domain-containing protein [Lachnotalea glycerini]|uniref:DUF4340 domain-containing protein n=1 Tax=Lachnotalea glycerini TaxID=1763509 RepID=A0A371JFI7_9FIRM|nr:DUF4340 domain-containing protein [Lachnotalea glycerini]RDY31524.1 DUF4340 domain-containing protein [Lachnotalea glycerini]
MTKKNKMIKLITMIIILVSVLVAYIAVEKVNKNTQEKESLDSENAESISINSIDPEAVAAFSYTYDGIDYGFYKENDIWYSSNDPTKELDQDKVSNLAQNFQNVTASRLVEESASDLSQYGLDHPDNIIKVTDTDGNTTSYDIGSLNETVNGYYIKLEDKNTIYLISTFPTEFSYSLDDLIKTQEESTDEASDDNVTDATDSTETTTQE